MEAIGQLAGGIAHDFNNQLAGIMGYADIILLEANQDVLKSYASKILQASERTGELTKKMLAFARKGQHQSIPVDLHELVHEVVDILNRSIDKNIEIRLKLSANPSTTKGDPTQLQNAILNLAINARDAMPNGGVIRIETSVKNLDEAYCLTLPYKVKPANYLCLCITDTGIGIPAENIRRIFEPFFTTKKVNQGTGLGLAAVYGTVKHHGGAINVYSEAELGTTFRLYLPVEYIETEPHKPTSPKLIQKKHTENLLVVDDEELIRNLSKTILTALGYKVTTFAQGQDAVDHFREHWRNVDLVILDMIMPKMNGTETYRLLKQIRPDVKVLLSSGYSLNGTAQALLNEGVKGFIQKPFTIAQLSEKLASILAD